jgi:hypothetical protein
MVVSTNAQQISGVAIERADQSRRRVRNLIAGKVAKASVYQQRRNAASLANDSTMIQQ